MKYVYKFSKDVTEGDRSMRELLGGKGANLAEMCTIGLPVPPGFTVTTEACRFYSEHGHAWPDELKAQVAEGIKHTEDALGRKLGDPSNPLLVSVRSGAAVSMPGMMDTVLNLGMNDAVAEGLAKQTGNERFAFDSYRRFIDMFGDVVMGVPHEHYEHAISALKEKRGVEEDVQLTAADLRELVSEYKAIYQKHTGNSFPEDPEEQLRLAINAVFGSWDSDRAIKYRQINRIQGLIGTAVNVMAMVYGNTGDNSGTGVCFTRNPSNGEAKLYGEFLVNAQGEDVVAGIRTPQPIVGMGKALPKAYEELLATTQKLEKHYKNMQDIEFTVQDGELYLLQTRNGKRTGVAAVRIALDLAKEYGVDPIDLVEPEQLEQLLHPSFEGSAAGDTIIGKGLPASPGAAVGQVVFSAKAAEDAASKGEKVILVRTETSPEDVGGMNAAQGILTSRGGMTSHAAVVARGWGKPCVAGCGEVHIDYAANSFTAGKHTVKAGDWISIDGTSGEVMLGKRELSDSNLPQEFTDFMAFVDKADRGCKVRANADTPADAKKAIEFGAVGIGLCRTEHMFFEAERILHVREMILAETLEARTKALAKLLPFQRSDFIGIFEAVEGRPVTIRLLDPPLHEFLPQEPKEQEDVAKALGVTPERIVELVNALHEINPMLGHRGCRLGITYPEITEMQARAIIEAAVHQIKQGLKAVPEIMVPLVGTLEEFEAQKKVIVDTANAVIKESGVEVSYTVGTMIETPRAALVAGEIAQSAEFFSFGTNDLTQMSFGYSRDDAAKFLGLYVNQKILSHDPFQSIDKRGVGRLLKMGFDQGRETRPNLKVGICGEHGGDPDSIAFVSEVGLDYVSCSPFRVPVARLAAVQAAKK